MVTKLTLDIHQRTEAFVDGVTTKYRVITKIVNPMLTSLPEPPEGVKPGVPPASSAQLPPYTVNAQNCIQNCFLLKRVTPTQEEYLSQSRFMRLLQPEDFKVTSGEDGTDLILGVDNTTWENLVIEGKISDYMETDDTPEETRAASLSTPHFYYVSSLVVGVYDSPAEAGREAQNLEQALRAMVTRFNAQFAQFSSTADLETFPQGWEIINVG